MPSANLFVVGCDHEVAHHAAPLADNLRLSIIQPDEAAARANPGDVAIFFSEHFDRNREAIRLLREKSVATIYAIDGILEWRNLWTHREHEPACPWTMRPVLCDKVACIGRHQARILQSWGNQDRVELVGIPRLDAAASRFLVASNEPRTQPESGAFRLLVMTAKFPAFTEQQHATTVKALKDLRDWLAHNPQIQNRPIETIWRLSRGLDREIGVPNSMNETRGQELAGQLALVDAVISTPSTAVLEAMLHDKPVATLDYHRVPEYVVPAWKIDGADAIDEVLHALLNPSEDRMHYQRSTLRDELECDGNSTRRMAELVNGMMQHAADCLARQQPMKFPARIVQFPQISPLEFPTKALFPDQASSQGSDQQRLQAELAHARREIIVLNADIRQLRSELGQAHKIFEQINRHPIAGPVVRLRQRLIDAWKRWRRGDTSDTTSSAALPADSLSATTSTAANKSP